MILVQTYTLTPANISNSTVAYPTTGIDNTALWVAGTTYALNALVYYNNKNYTSLQASNSGKQPDINPTFWLDTGSCNRFKMIDSIISSQVQADNSLTFDIDTNVNNVGHIGFFNLDCYNVTVKQIDADNGNVISNNTYSMYDDQVVSWQDYYFLEPEFKSTLVVQLAPYKNSKVTCTIEKTGSTAKLGTVAIGSSTSIGATLYDVDMNLIDYSIKDVNTTTGDVTLKQGKSADNPNLTIGFSSKSLDSVYSKVKSRRGVVSMWVADETDKYKSLSILGFYRDFKILLSNPTWSTATISLESLT